MIYIAYQKLLILILPVVRYPAVLATSSGTSNACDQQMTNPTITSTLQYHAVPHPLSSAE